MSGCSLDSVKKMIRTLTRPKRNPNMVAKRYATTAIPQNWFKSGIYVNAYVHAYVRTCTKYSYVNVYAGKLARLYQ